MTDSQKTFQMIRSFPWEESSATVEKSEAWYWINRNVLESLTIGQWEGLRRQGETAVTWEEYRFAMEDWLTHPPEKNKERRPVKKWDVQLADGLPLVQSLLREIESASKPTTSGKRKSFEAAGKGLDKSDWDKLDQLYRVQQARKFVVALVTRLKVQKGAKTT